MYTECEQQQASDGRRGQKNKRQMNSSTWEGLALILDDNTVDGQLETLDI